MSTVNNDFTTHFRQVKKPKNVYYEASIPHVLRCSLGLNQPWAFAVCLPLHLSPAFLVTLNYHCPIKHENAENIYYYMYINIYYLFICIKSNVIPFFFKKKYYAFSDHFTNSQGIGD